MTIEQLNAFLPEPINGLKMRWYYHEWGAYILSVGQNEICCYSKRPFGWCLFENFVTRDWDYYKNEELAARQCVEYGKEFIQKLFI